MLNFVSPISFIHPLDAFHPAFVFFFARSFLSFSRFNSDGVSSPFHEFHRFFFYFFFHHQLIFINGIHSAKELNLVSFFSTVRKRPILLHFPPCVTLIKYIQTPKIFEIVSFFFMNMNKFEFFGEMNQNKQKIQTSFTGKKKQNKRRQECANVTTKKLSNKSICMRGILV